jgi:hypothetical protein
MANDPDKVSVLNIPSNVWDGSSPQQQILFIMQQLMGYMASELFGETEGVTVQIYDPAMGVGRNTRTIFQVGKPPRQSPIIGAN